MAFLPKILYLLLGIGLLFGTPAAGEPFGWEDEKVILGSDQNWVFQSVIVKTDSQDNVNILWRDRIENALYYKKTDSQGNPIGTVLRVSGNTLGNNTTEFDLRVDQSDAVHVIWLSGVISPYQLQYRKISPDGQMATPIIPITNDSNGFSSFGMALDGNDDIHLIMIDKMPYPQSSVKFQKIDDEGNILIPTTSLNIPRGNHNRPSLDVDENGFVSAAWGENRTWPDNRIVMVRLDNVGNLLMNQIINPPIYRLEIYDVKVFIDPQQNLALIWGNRNNCWYIGCTQWYYQKYDLDGNALTPFTQIGNSGSTYSAPKIKPDFHGDLHLIQYYVSGTTTRVYYNKAYSDGGTLFYLNSSKIIFQSTSGLIYGVNMDIDSKNQVEVVFSINHPSGGSELYQKKSIPLPVLFVHGIYADDDIWDPLETLLGRVGYQTYRVGRVLSQKGLVPNNGDIGSLKDQMAEALNIIHSNTGNRKVDVVGHSMGGLAARAYIASNGYRGDINRLFLLGTPNEGTNMARHPFGQKLNMKSGDDPKDTARYQMIPYSFFLNVLNRAYDSKGVPHIGIAGTRLYSLVTRWPLCKFLPSFCYPADSHIPNDNVVPVASVQAFTSQCYLADVVHGKYDPNYYSHAPTLTQILSLMRDGNTTLGNCPASLASHSQTPSLEIKEGSGVVDPNQTIDVFPIPFPRDVLTIATTSRAGGFYPILLLPQGGTISRWNYFNFPGVQYTSVFDQNVYYREFHITHPQNLDANGGIWMAQANLYSGATPADFNMIAYIGRPIGIQSGVDKTEYFPQETMVISTRIFDLNTNAPGLGATVITTLIQPDGVTHSIPLFDDGNHSDGGANDGLYAAPHDLGSLAGPYLLDINANGVWNGAPFYLEERISTSLIVAPDLKIGPNAIQFSNSYPLPGETITVRATIRNIGNADASNATIEFWDDDPIDGGQLIGTQIISIPAGQSVSVAHPFSGDGSYNFTVFPSPSNAFPDYDYSNEKASAQIQFCQRVRSVSTGNAGPGCVSVAP
ncbi:MAG: CARDB domain-containing protein [Candidatus Diapherotrites archaeon]|nr:CARDB domain-containing protein [Candidatus Diapherotrites archaeon]MDZ4256785.1 CARDB domain-containing protein [archaeon]